MPLPLFLIGAAAVTGALGVGKTVKAGIDNSNAKKINESANERIKLIEEKLNIARKSCGESLESLGQEKLFILENNVNEFIKLFEKIKNIDFKETVGLNEFNKLNFDKLNFLELKELGNFASSLMEGAVAGVAGGAFAAFGAYSAATTFATASTGTAIASLSGVAATNATLAFFGGGSIAAGGLGIAGGTAVLGGIVAAPALMVLGVIAGSKASKNLDEAYSNSAKANEICEQLEAAIFQCQAIRRRTYMFYDLLARLDSYFLPLIYEMEKNIETEGTDYSEYTLTSQKKIVACVSIASSIKTILDTAILTESGELTENSELIFNNVCKELNTQNENVF